MSGMMWILDIVLVVLLGTTLFHAVRLERALGVLKRDRASLEALVAAFNASTRAAESGIERLRASTDGAGRQIQRQIDSATTLKDDLTFLVQRGEGLADRLDESIQTRRPAASASVPESPYSPRDDYIVRDEPKVPSQAERDLLKALRMAR